MNTNESTISREMTVLEIQVLNAIRNGASIDSPISGDKLRRMMAINKRMLENTIESLRVNFRHPIVAKKNAPSGYYLPRTDEERAVGVAPYQRQIETEQKNLAMILGIDLAQYWKEVENV